MKTSTQFFQQYRRLGWKATDAYRAAQLLADWASAGGETLDRCETTNEPGTVRIVITPDFDAESVTDYDCCKGDNHGASAYAACRCRGRCEYGQPCKHKCETARRADRDGVYGIVGQYYDETAKEWFDSDSVWGFIGDDWRDSGYDQDIMRSALTAYHTANARYLMPV